jgi:murein DD-endopeptidase MepM/ murein hydrolase activator NlpD
MPPTARLVIQTDAPCEQEIAIGQRQYSLQNITGVPQQMVTPSEAHLERIRSEREKVRAAKALRLMRDDGLNAVQTGFSWPVTGRISGVYGSQRIYNGTPGSPHYGVDVARPNGTSVLAPAPGEVTLAEPDLFYSGGTVILDHGYGLSSSFLHLSEVSVSVGDRLQTGDRLGAIGATGRATGPHLDWRMSWLSQRIDPQLLVPPMPD